MNDYQNVIKQIEALKCPACSGSGKIDDVDLGDISFNTWPCTACYGTGFSRGNTHVLQPITFENIKEQKGG